MPWLTMVDMVTACLCLLIMVASIYYWVIVHDSAKCLSMVDGGQRQGITNISNHSAEPEPVESAEPKEPTANTKLHIKSRF